MTIILYRLKWLHCPMPVCRFISLKMRTCFKRKYIFHDEKEKWFDDNGLRTVFFCKGALETVKKFGWPPDIIHCSGWMTGLIPLYLKTVYKKEPVFAHSKVVFTIGQNTFKEKLGADFPKTGQYPRHDKGKGPGTV